MYSKILFKKKTKNVIIYKNQHISRQTIFKTYKWDTQQ